MPKQTSIRKKTTTRLLRNLICVKPALGEKEKCDYIHILRSYERQAFFLLLLITQHKPQEPLNVESY